MGAKTKIIEFEELGITVSLAKSFIASAMPVKNQINQQHLDLDVFEQILEIYVHNSKKSNSK